ncbi:hypothetical protein [Mycolicibacterium peregrinum]|uniref:Lipoprotein n=1 Tax=Mycolicibacterium peregrinum TaxID=43304 RepID=A0A1A0V7P8_MYCPR|nr:hypothetical protein [Mycolicibacterium peregrinum]OBB79270.1 hypothetical protein A5779_12785 [Mycolicibacterium peregrinum]
MIKMVFTLLAALVLSACGASPNAAPARSSESAERPQATTTAASTADIEGDFRTNFGETNWGMAVTGFSFKDGNLHVSAQIDASDKATAEKIQRGVVNLIRTGGPYAVGPINWVIVEDGTGVVVTQQKV